MVCFTNFSSLFVNAEVINWSYILKYLLGSASKLRRAVTDEKTHTTATTGP